MSALQSFAENLWIADGPQVRDAGIMFSTRMTIVRLADGSIWIESPVPASFEMIQSITKLGPIKYLVSATPRHVWRLDLWHTLFPDAQLWSCRDTLVTLKKGSLPVTGFLGDTPPTVWAGDFDQCMIVGNPLLSEVFFFHKTSRTLITGDVIQNHAPRPGDPLHNALIALAGVEGTEGKISHDIRIGFMDRKQAQRAFQKIMSWDFDKLIIAHGDCITHNAKMHVERAFKWLES